MRSFFWLGGADDRRLSDWYYSPDHWICIQYPWDPHCPPHQPEEETEPEVPEQPADQLAWCELKTLLTSLDIYSIGGPNWPTQLDAICTALGDTVDEPNELCQYLRFIPDSDEFELGLKVLDHMVQQAFTGEHDVYNPDWCTNGWLDETDTAEYDLSGISVPVNPWYIDGETSCNETAARSILNPLAGAFANTFWTDGRTNSEGDNDRRWVGEATL